MPVLALFIHGARRFRMAKTSYRGIRFGYRGDKVALIKLMFWSIVPFYYPNFKNKFRVYVYGNTRFGNVEAEFTGDEKIYAGIYWRSLILCFVTLGIYYPWYKARLFNYFWKNLSFNKDGNYIRIESKATAAKFFNLKIGNLLILALTLGMGQPIAKVRSLHFLTNNLEMYGNIDLDTVIQTEEQYNSTIGDAADIDDSADFFDMDIF
ncbi:MAG: DUF898 domain-containing protein, partial [Chitinispirillales bacterium]|jgi:uncharacterized membrane protein YjgN (DUF898 family)|nr:DUF898 domain-containing protein [Chitinispirillales bacterium]